MPEPDRRFREPKPQMTREILNGLIRAYDHYDECDLLNLTSEQSNEHDAAGHWLEMMEDWIMKQERHQQQQNIRRET